MREFYKFYLSEIFSFVFEKNPEMDVPAEA